MSHALGEVIYDGKVVGYYEYNGSVDIALNRIFDDEEDLWHNHWRTKFANNAKCVCGKSPKDVVLYSHYGYGFHWPAKACLDCRAILDGRDPWNSEMNDYQEPIGPCDGHPLEKGGEV